MRRALVLCLLLPVAALAAGGGSADEPRESGPSAERRYNEGLVLTRRAEWVKAEAAYRDAVRLKPGFAEAWSELGHALKGQKRWDDSVKAYQEALRLRPDFPQALEYLGEAYVQMGKTAEARAVFERLKPLDPKLAAQLDKAIAAGKAGY